MISPMAVLRAMRMAWRSTRWLLAGTVITQVVASLGVPAQLAVTKVLVDRVVAGGEVVSLVVVLVAVTIGQRLTALAMSSLLTLGREQAAAGAVSRYLDKAAHLDAGYLIDSAFLDRMRHAGEVADERFGAVVFGSVNLLGAVTSAVALTAVLAVISPVVAVLVVASMVPWVIAEQRGFNTVRLTRMQLLSGRRQQSYLRNLVTDADAALELLASGAGAAVTDRHRALSADLLRQERPAHIRQFRTIAIGDLAGAAFLAVAFMAAVDGRASAGEIAAVIGGLAHFLASGSRLANGLSGLLAHGPYLKDYFAFLDAPPLITTPAVPARLPRTLGQGLVFDDVTFRYPSSDVPVLRNVTLKVAPGELLALVGPNGAGKTTLIKLLLRFFDPDSGRITLGGVDLRECDPTEIRSRIGVVFQDYARYQFTVRDVVRMGRPGAHGPETAALDAAGLTLSLDDQVGRLFPGGHDLSGGQWQRLALARLYYRNADVLVLDEPTSSLDEEGEARTFRELRERLEGRIGIVISHRPSTVRAADRVLTLTPYVIGRSSAVPYRSLRPQPKGPG